MLSFLDMPCFYIWNIPDILWILPDRVPTPLPFFWTLIMFFSRIFLGDADTVWVAAGFKDTLLRCQKSEVVYGYKAAIQPGIQD